jgi:hypothetical protein
MGFGCAHDGRGHCRLMQPPGQRHLSARQVPGFSDLAQAVHHRPVGRFGGAAGAFGVRVALRARCFLALRTARLGGPAPAGSRATPNAPGLTQRPSFRIHGQPGHRPARRPPARPNPGGRAGRALAARISTRVSAVSSAGRPRRVATPRFVPLSMTHRTACKRRNRRTSLGRPNACRSRR